jgi:hypothetical protein
LKLQRPDSKRVMGSSACKEEEWSDLVVAWHVAKK